MKARNKIVAGIVAFLMTLSPLQANLSVFADEVTDESEASIEEVQADADNSTESAGAEVTEPEDVESEPETALEEVFEAPDYSEFAETKETTVIEVVETEEATTTEATATEETTIASEPTETQLESTDVVVEESEVVEEVENKIIAAQSSEEYYKLVSELPEGTERVIVETTADLSDVEVMTGVYYNGTYILVFDTQDSFSTAVKTFYDAGYEYAIDGTVGLCGNSDGIISYGSINPNASVKVAVIDTGSNIANEQYSVIGDDPSDYNGHGSAMASFVLDETDNAYIISIKAIGDNGQGNISDVYAAIQLAEDLGVDYILMAISVRNSGKYDAFISLVENTNATVVASAGNNSTDAAYYLPAGLNGVITVGAINGNGTLMTASNYGDCVDYYVEADSTSEAASKALGVIIDNRAFELATEYVDLSETGVVYHKVAVIDGDGNFIINSVGDDNISVWGGADADCQIQYFDYFNFDNTGYGNTHAMNDGSWSDATSGVYSNSVFCIQPQKETPGGSSTYANDRANWDASNNGLFQAALACAPGGSLYQLEIDWWRAKGSSALKITIPDSFSAVNVDAGNTNYATDPNRALYAIAHLAASYAYYNEDSSIVTIPDGAFGTAFYEYIAYLKELRNDSDYENWWAEVYECSWEARNDDPANYQSIARGGATYSPTNVTVKKTSANTAIVNGNSCYDMTGTTYGLYKTSNDELIHTFTLDASGNTTAYTLKSADGKDLYIKEISAGKGYKLDTSKHTVDFTTAVNKLVTVNVQDVPMADPIFWTVEKQDSNGWNMVTNMALSGAVFRIDYYDRTDIRTAADVATLNSATPKVSVNLTSSQVSGSRSGIVNVNVNTLAAADSTGYFSGFASTIRALPLGTYRVTEVSAPTGYAVANEPIVFYIYDNNGTTARDHIGNTTIYNAAAASDIIMSEKAQVGFYAPTKAASGSTITGLHNLNGTQYGIYVKANDSLIATVTFNGNGAISSVVYAAGITPTKAWSSGDTSFELAAGDYYAKELKAGNWFLVDNTAHNFTVTTNNTTTMNLSDTPITPKIQTTASDSDNGTHYLSYKERVTINDEISYSNLVPGETYTFTGSLQDADKKALYTDPDGNTYTKSITYTPTAANSTIAADGTASGKVIVTFTDVYVPLTKTTIVVFEDLYENKTGILIAAHEDYTDKNQTVERREIDLKTTATDADNGTHTLTYTEKVTINDSVEFTNLNPGEKYYFVGTLYDEETGKPYTDSDGKTYTQRVDFTATTENGTEVITFKDVPVPLTKTTIVAFEDLYEASTNLKIATHADLTDKNQTVKRVEVKTTATDADNGTHTLTYTEKVTINDSVEYTNLTPGEEYYSVGTLYDEETGKPYTDSDGKTYTERVDFTATTENGTVIITFKDVPIPFTKTTIVVFEDLYEKTSGLKIATHADLTDKDQTVRRPTAATSAKINNAKEIWLETTEVQNITISDTIEFTGLEVGTEYRAEATAYIVRNGETNPIQIMVNGMPIKSIVTFTPATTDGEVKVDITFSTEGLAEGDKVVIFEKVFDVATDVEVKAGTQTEDLLIARHEDITDTEQTITVHFRPMTGGVRPAYTTAGAMIAIVASALAGAWFVMSRRKRYREA